MPLLVEQERQVAQEANLINDPTQYSDATNAAWAAVHDYGNITIPSNGILLVKGEILLDVSGGSGFIRVHIGASTYFLTANTSLTTATAFGTAIYMPSGTYDVKVEGYLNATGSTRNLYLQNFQVGLCTFNDQQGSTIHTYSSGTALTVAARNTPAGALLNATYFVQVYAVTSGGSTSLEDKGDNLQMESAFWQTEHRSIGMKELQNRVRAAQAVKWAFPLLSDQATP